MAAFRAIGFWVLAATGLAASGTLAEAQESSPEAVLKEKGLKRSGSSYILTAETDFARKLESARKLFNEVTLAQAQVRAFELGTQSNKELMQQLLQQRIMLNQQLAQNLPAAQHNQLVALVNEVTDRINLLREGASDPKMAEKVRGHAADAREQYLQAMLDLRNQSDEIANAYSELEKDDAAKEALAALNQKTKAKLTIGPSRTFQANVKLLERAEKSIQSETIDLRKDSGVFWVDVTLNGKVMIPMVFDTGASIISLRADLAAKAGLKPGPNDQTIRLQSADGSVTEGKLMTLASVRVGKFVIENVQCAVMPADKDEAPPLLGGTFLRNFTYKMNAETGKLTLSRVETGTATKPASRTPTKGGRAVAKPKGPAED